IIGITIAAIWLGFLGASAFKQKTATQSVLKSGGFVFYDYQVRAGQVNLNAPLTVPWLRPFIGRDCIDTVVGVELNREKLSATDDELAEIIAALPNVNKLTVRFPPAGQRTLAAIKAAPELRILMIHGNSITDEH